MRVDGEHEPATYDEGKQRTAEQVQTRSHHEDHGAHDGLAAAFAATGSERDSATQQVKNAEEAVRVRRDSDDTTGTAQIDGNSITDSGVVSCRGAQTESDSMVDSGSN